MSSREDRGTDFISIAIADATHIHTQLLAGAMRNDAGLQVVASTSQPRELLAAAERVPIDVAVLSYALDNQPGRGLELLRGMRALRPRIKGVILLDSTHPKEVVESFRAGAKGIFSKEERLENLSKCIRCVHDGQVWASSTELEHLLEALHHSPRVSATNQNGVALLSSRERQVVEYLAGGMTNREIAKALDLSPHTVKNYLFRIFDKVGVSSRTELLYLAMSSSHEPASTGAEGEVSNVFQAAASGVPSAQVRMAEHCTQGSDTPADPVAAYMWYLLADQATAQLANRIEEGKTRVGDALTPQQRAEAERRAAEWLKSARKESAFAASNATLGKRAVGTF